MQKPQRTQAADEFDGTGQQYLIIRPLGRAFQKFHDESHQPAHQYRPSEGHPQQFTKAGVLPNLTPRHRLLFRDVFLGHGGIRHAVNEPETHRPHNEAEREHNRKPIVPSGTAEIPRGQQQSDQTTDVVGGCLHREITAADFLRNNSSDPWKPRGAGYTAHEVKSD